MAEVVRELFVEIGLIGQDLVQGGFRAVEQSADSLTEKMKGMRTAFLFAAFGFMAAGGLITRVSQQFQQAGQTMTDSFSKVERQAIVAATILGKTSKDVRIFTNVMLDSSRKFGFAAEDVGEAMRTLAAAGFTVEQTLGGADAVLKLARIGLTSTDEAARILVGTFHSFGFEATTAAHATETLSGIAAELAEAANISAIAVSDLGESLKFAGNAASLVGFSLEETVAMLVVAGNNMIRAGIAGRAMRESFLRLAQIIGRTEKETENARDAVKRLGIQLTDTRGRAKSVAAIIDELNDKMKGLSSAQRLATIETLFGTEAVGLWASVLEEGGDSIRRLELRLKAAATKEALFIHFGRDMTDTMIEWRGMVQEGETAFKFLTDELGLAPDIALRVDELLRDNTLTTEGWTKAIREASLASNIMQERLKTLSGTQDLLRSSVSSLYAAFGQDLAPILMQINRLIKIFADWIAKLPAPLRLIIAATVLFGGTLGVLIGRLLTTIGTFVIMIAAVSAYNIQAGKSVTISGMFGIGLRMLAASAIKVARQLVILAGAVLRLMMRMALVVAAFLIAEHIFHKFGTAGKVVAVVVAALVGWLIFGHQIMQLFTMRTAGAAKATLFLSRTIAVNLLRALGVEIRTTQLAAMTQRQLWAAVKNVTIAKMQGFWVTVKENAATLFGVIAKKGEVIWTVISTKATYALGTAKLFAANAARTLWSALGPIGVILLIIGAALAWIITHWEEFVKFIQPVIDALKKLWGWLANLIMPILQALGQVWGFLWNSIVKPFFDFIIGALKFLAEAITKTFGWLIDLIKWLIDAFKGIGGWIMQLFGGSDVPDMIAKGVAESNTAMSEMGRGTPFERAFRTPEGVAGAGAVGGGRSATIAVNINNPSVRGPTDLANLEFVTQKAVEKALKRWDFAFEKEQPT